MWETASCLPRTGHAYQLTFKISFHDQKKEKKLKDVDD